MGMMGTCNEILLVAGKHPKMALLFPVESSSVSQVAGLESDEVAAHKCVLASRREPRGCHLGPW